MKKKILCLLLSLVLALGALCAFAGCDDSASVLPPSQGTEQGGTQKDPQEGTQSGGQEGNQGNQESQGSQGSQGGQQGNQGGQQGNQGGEGQQGDQTQQGGQGQQSGGSQTAPDYRVGDRITDEATLQKLKESMTTQFKGVRGSVEYDLEEESAVADNEKDVKFELFSDFEGAAFDLRMAMSEEESEQVVSANYGVMYGRNGEVYIGQGSWSEASLRAEDWNGLLGKYKSGALLLEKMTKEEMQQNGNWGELLLFSSFDPAMLSALADYSGGSFYKTEDGYELRIPLLGTNGLLDKIFSDLERLVGSLDFEKPLSDLFADDAVKAQLAGVSAEEVTDALQNLLTGEEGLLPEARDGETAYDYLARILQDEALYEAATGEKGTFGALTIADIFKKSGENMTKEEILQSIQELHTNFEETLLQSLTGGYDRVLKRDFEIEFEFDRNGNFYSVDFDGEVEWTKGSSTFDMNFGMELNFLKTAPVLSDITGVKTEPNA